MTADRAEELASLRRLMDEAAQQGRFEQAAQLRDRISLLRAARDDELAENVDPSGLVRQKPGAMGLGTGHPRLTPPPGWAPPKKPDPMTKGSNRRRKSPPD